MPAVPPGPRVTATGLWLPPGLRVSFQRYAGPAGGAQADAVPASLGLLPVAPAPSGALLLPVGAGEAFWIGLEAGAPLQLTLDVVARDGGVEHIDRQVAGPDRIGGHAGLAFTRPPLDCLRFATAGGRATVQVVDAAVFMAATGRPAPAPLDLSAGYRGWRLP